MDKFGNNAVKSCVIFIAGQLRMIAVLTVLMFSLHLSISAQEVSVVTYQCKQAKTPISIDGKLDEPAWKNATPIELKLAEDSGRPRFPTTARMLWDDKYLYVGYHCVDEDVWATMTKRDDSYGKKRLSRFSSMQMAIAQVTLRSR